MASAIANRYAAALADVLVKPGAMQSPESALEQLRAFEGLTRESAELRNVLTSPAAATPQKKNLTGALAQRIGVGPAVRNLLFILIDHHRMGALAEVVAAYAAVLDERRGVARIHVSSALPMPDDQRNQVIEKFRRLTGKAVEADFTSDESLLGGSIIRVGGKVYDGSLRAQLAALDRAMSDGH
ncbi:MAG: ATP synthase F1 subunit delta [Bryobacterales bacterium]